MKNMSMGGGKGASFSTADFSFDMSSSKDAGSSKEMSSNRISRLFRSGTDSALCSGSRSPARSGTGAHGNKSSLDLLVSETSQSIAQGGASPAGTMWVGMRSLISSAAGTKPFSTGDASPF